MKFEPIVIIIKYDKIEFVDSGKKTREFILSNKDSNIHTHEDTFTLLSTKYNKYSLFINFRKGYAKLISCDNNKIIFDKHIKDISERGKSTEVYIESHLRV